jgi:iron complex outermembrane receptor protein
MKIKILMLLSIIFSITSFAQTGSISGTVVDATTQEPLMGTNIVIRGTNTGVSTDENGNYSLKNLKPEAYVIDVFYIGYENASQNVVVTEGANLSLNFSLNQSSSIMDEVVLSANRRPQKVTRAPATIAIIGAEEISNYAGNIGELASRQKGVDFVRSGVQGTGINIRGFNSAFNSKNLQVEDGRISTLVATGLPFGSFTTITKDDI